MLKGTGTESAHIALDSDCFSKATVSTRLCTPAETSEEATKAVERARRIVEVARRVQSALRER